MELILLNPITYVALILVALQYRRQVEVERSIFGVRIHSMTQQSLRSIGYGVLAGIVASILILGLGITLRYTDFLIVWGISLILVLFRVRFLCIAYAGGITAILAYAASLWPQGTDIAYLSWLWQPLLDVNIPSLTALIAILHIIETFLYRLHTAANATPVFIESKRGKIVGAYELKAFWFIPLLILAPGTDSFFIDMPSWWPLFGTAAGISLFTVPALIGFSDLAANRTVKQKSAFASNGILIYGVILLGLSFLAVYVPILAIIPAVVAVLGHESISLISRWRDREAQPLFYNDSRGIMVLAIVPNSPAAEMELKPGEIISKVNGIPVQTKAEMYEAIQKQSGAFCKLDVINLEGHVRFVNRAIYDGESHQLGILSGPEGYVNKYLKREDIHLLDLFYYRNVKRKKRKRLAKPTPQKELSM